MLLDLLEELQAKILEYITDIRSLFNLSLCSRSCNVLCQSYMWKKVKLPLLDFYLESHACENLIQRGEHLQHTESIKLTDDGISRVRYFEEKTLEQLLTLLPNLLATCDNLSVLHTDLFLPGSVWEGLTHLKLQEVTLSQSAATDEALLVLRNAQHHLNSLSVEANLAKFSDEGMSHIAGMNSVRKINLSHCTRITPVGFSHLSRMPHLAALRLYSCSALNDKCVQTIATIGTLKDLSLLRCHRLTMQCLDYISLMRQLELLDISGCRRMRDVFKGPQPPTKKIRQ